MIKKFIRPEQSRACRPPNNHLQTAPGRFPRPCERRPWRTSPSLPRIEASLPHRTGAWLSVHPRCTRSHCRRSVLSGLHPSWKISSGWAMSVKCHEEPSLWHDGGEGLFHVA
ncbi:unnamed protein product [Heterosigma akashiwo]